jgi:predicted Zn finger-like uncharacterized protein
MKNTLSQKLERARTERLIASGDLPGSAALKPEPTEQTAPTERPLWDPIEVQVRPLGLFAVNDAPVGPPSKGIKDVGDHPCPSCKTIGLVDLVDLVGHRIHVSCPRCGSMWQVRTDVPTDAR